nr:DUF3570 domain-containing protein [Ideonella sp. A 288]
MAATDGTAWKGLCRALWAASGSLLAAAPAAAVDLPDNRAEALLHVYDGGGTTASGPAFLVRKRVGDALSLSGSVYVDMVSNASVDVVTTASPFHERRTAVDLGLEHVVRDATIKLGLGQSSEPDYRARSLSLDVTQEVFGGMTTVALGFSRGADDVGKKGTAGFFDRATHWQYRLGATQVLSPRWLASVNLEALADDGYLGSPYRVARVFGAAVPERHPRTRSGRAARLPRAATWPASACCAPSTATTGTTGPSRRTRWKSATAATSARCGRWRAACACTARAPRCSTATTPAPRRCTCRATASCPASRAWG